MAIGVFSGSDGDLELFDQALKVLAAKGANRFLFAGGRYADLDEWVRWKRDVIRAQTDYSDLNFLEDLQRYMIGLEQLERPPAFGNAWELSRVHEEAVRLRGRITRTPERGSLAFQDSAVPRKTVDLLASTICCLVYDKNDLEKEDLINATVLVHGEQPEPGVVQIGPRFFVSPGQLRAKKTVGLLQVEPKLSFSAFTLEGKLVIDHQALEVAAKTKLTVK